MTIYTSNEPQKMLFHYNKSHITNPNNPRWILRSTPGSLTGFHFEVWDVICKVPFTTENLNGRITMEGIIQIHQGEDGKLIATIE